MNSFCSLVCSFIGLDRLAILYIFIKKYNTRNNKSGCNALEETSLSSLPPTLPGGGGGGGSLIIKATRILFGNVEKRLKGSSLQSFENVS